TMDRLAQMGLRYTMFHSASLCSPTRAALITGRNHHSVHFGVVAEAATGYPGYNSIIDKDTATVGEILRDNGYATSWSYNLITAMADEAILWMNQLNVSESSLQRRSSGPPSSRSRLQRLAWNPADIEAPQKKKS